MEKAPNGYFWNGLLWYETHRTDEVVVAKGFELQLADLTGASVAALNDFHERLSTLLYSLPDGYQAQVQWSVDNDYSDSLLAYKRVTDKITDPWPRYIRNERYHRHVARMEAGQLRRQKLVLYLSRKASTVLSRYLTRERKIVDHVSFVASQEAQTFQNIQIGIQQALGSTSKVTGMSDEDHWLHYRGFLNPSLQNRRRGGLGEFDPEATIQELCWRSDGMPQDEASFAFDDHYHSLFVVTRWPKWVEPGQVRWLTGLGFNDYSMTCNLYPLSVKEETKKEEDLIERLSGQVNAGGRRSLLTSLKKKNRKVDELQEGYTRPINALYVIRVWATGMEELVARNQAIKQAIADMGAQYYHITRPTTAWNIFYQTWPGWSQSAYRGWDVYATNQCLADLLPFASTFIGHLDAAEALYDGAENNLVGIRTFAGDTPQHAVVFGGSGAGKSAFLTDLLTQTDPYYADGLTVLIEEGLSYEVYTRLKGENPIIIQPNGELTLNYFDTFGLPLTNNNLTFASSLCQRMIGLSGSDKEDKLRKAQLNLYISALLSDGFSDWSARNEDQLPMVTRRAFALDKFRKERMPADETFLDAFTTFRDWEALATNGEPEEFIASIDEGALLMWSKTGDGERMIRDLAFAYFRPDEFPTHSGLVETLSIARGGSPEETRELREMSTLLSSWAAGQGQSGRLVDGVSNINLHARHLHFELSKIPKEQVDMKSVAAFLINNTINQKVMTLPRAKRKRIVFEEVARILRMPGGTEMVEGGYATYRKYNAWLVSVVQQYKQYRDTPARAVINGNSKHIFLMNMDETEDLEDLANAFTLPSVTIQTIRSYPSPEHLPKGGRFSSCTYFVKDSQKPLNGTFRNVACPEMLLCSTTDGKKVTWRNKELAKFDDVMTGVLTLANQQ